MATGHALHQQESRRPEQEPEKEVRPWPPTFPAALRRLRTARDLLRSESQTPPRPPLATAVPALDRLLGGGLPRGRLIELVGRRSCGRFSIVLAALAAATRRGETAALVDLGDHLDPASAAALGIELPRLLWLRPRHVREALAGAETILGSGFPLVVLDLGAPPVRGGRGPRAGWIRLARAAAARDSALLVASPYRATGTAATGVVSVERRQTLWNGLASAPPLLAGLTVHLATDKLRCGAEGTYARACWQVPCGIVSLPSGSSTGEVDSGAGADGTAPALAAGR